MSADPDFQPQANATRHEQIRRVVNERQRRVLAGERISEAELLSEHADLMPELADELKKRRLLAAAWEVAHRDDAAGEPSDSAASGQGQLLVRCPHCHAPNSVVVDSSLDSINCGSCGQGFSLIGADDDGAQLRCPRHIGRFEIMASLGVGGFGSVWKAWDAELDRFVAVKIPRRSGLTSTETEQFFREARAAAQLHHPGIVSIHEVGRDEDQLYIVSDLVEGVSLAEWSMDQRMTTHEAAVLCQRIAAALAHAHGAGIVHRDLKPANILLDCDGTPHLTDFGLASRREFETTVTADGQLLGTPAYMSPEQARGESHQADERSDLFSLGVILYELLTGELPFRGSTRMMLEQIVDGEPTRPRALNSLIPRDLETIALKCLEKEPARRYASAGALAEDLGRYLRGEPIVARPIGRLERGWRWCKRKPVVAGLMAVVVMLLIGLCAATSWTAYRERAFSTESARAERKTRHRLYGTDMELAMRAWEDASIARVAELLNQNLPGADDEDLRGFEWYYLWRNCERSAQAQTWAGATSLGLDPTALGFSADDRLLIVVDGNGTAAVIDLESNDVVSQFPLLEKKAEPTVDFRTTALRGAAVSPDGRWIASISDDSAANLVRVWSVGDHELRCSLEGPSNLGYSLAFSQDGTMLAAVTIDGSILIWDVEDGALLDQIDTQMPGTQVTDLSPDKRELVLVSGKVAYLWRIKERRPRFELKGHNVRVHHAEFSPNGSVLATAAWDNTITLWNPSTGEPIRTLSGHSEWVYHLAFSPDGTLLYSASDDNTVRSWETESGNLHETFVGHADNVHVVAISHGGGKLASAGIDATVKVWDATAPDRWDCRFGHLNSPNRIAVAPSGKRIATGDERGDVLIWDLEHGILEHRHSSPQTVVGLGYCEQGKCLVAVGFGGLLTVLDVPSWTVKHQLQLSDVEVYHASVSHDGRLLALARRDGGVELRVLPNLQLADRFSTGKESVLAVAFSADDQSLATAHEGGALKIWRTTTRTLPRSPGKFEGNATCAAFSPDGQWFAAGSEDGVVQIWNATNWEAHGPRLKHSSGVQQLCFSPDSQCLASSSKDHLCKLWNVAEAEQRGVLSGHVGWVWDVAFSPDGRTIMTVAGDLSLRVWRAAAPEDVVSAK